MSKYVDLIPWEACPHLLPPVKPASELAEFEAKLSPHQRQARRTGRPSLGAGAIYPVDTDDLLIDPIPIPPHWKQGYGMDPGWRVTAAVFGAWDVDHDIIYLTGEYYGRENQPVVHGHSIRAMMQYELRGAIDPASNSMSQRDGKRLIDEYRGLGLDLIHADNAVEAGIHRCLERMQTGRLKVFRTMTNWLKEIRLYRREARSKQSTQPQIIKENDHLMDAMRYLLMTDGTWKQNLPDAGAGVTTWGEF